MATGNPILSYLGNIGGNIMDVGKSIIGMPTAQSTQSDLVAGAPRVGLLGTIKTAMPAVRGIVNVGSDIGDAIEDVYGKHVDHNMKDFQLGKRIMPALGKGYGLIHENILGPLFGYSDPSKPYVDAGNDVEARDKTNPLTPDPNPTFSFSPLLSDPISESQIGGLGVDSYGNEMVGSLAMAPELRDSFDDLLGEPDEDEADEVMVEAGPQSLATQNNLDPREDIDGDGIPNFLDPDFKAQGDFSMLTGDPLGPEPEYIPMGRTVGDIDSTTRETLLKPTDFSRLLDDEEPTDFSILLDPSGEGVSNIVEADTTTDFSRLLEGEREIEQLILDANDSPEGRAMLEDLAKTDYGKRIIDRVLTSLQTDPMPTDYTPDVQSTEVDTDALPLIGPDYEFEYEGIGPNRQPSIPTEEELDFQEEFMRLREENPLMPAWELRSKMEQARELDPEFQSMMEEIESSPELPEIEIDGDNIKMLTGREKGIISATALAATASEYLDAAAREADARGVRYSAKGNPSVSSSPQQVSRSGKVNVSRAHRGLPPAQEKITRTHTMSRKRVSPNQIRKAVEITAKNPALMRALRTALKLGASVGGGGLILEWLDRVDNYESKRIRAREEAFGTDEDGDGYIFSRDGGRIPVGA